MIFTYIILGFVVLIAVVVGIWLLIILFKEKEIPSDENLILNINSHLDGSGRFLLSEKTVDKTSYTDRTIITGTPKDVDWKKLKTLKLDVKDVKTIVEEDKVINCPKGTLSYDKNIKILLPPTPEDLPEVLKDTPLGNAFASYLETKNYNKEILNIVREGSNLKSLYLKKLGDGEISNELVEQYKKLFTMLKDLADKKTSTSTGYIPPRT